MTNVPKFNGSSGCHWAVSSTSITGYGNLVLTSTDQTSEADVETAQDASGFTALDVSFNHRQTAALETWVSGSSVNGAAVISDNSYPQPGDTVTIVDAVNTALSGSNWIAGNATTKRAHNTMAKVSVALRRYAKF